MRTSILTAALIVAASIGPSGAAQPVPTDASGRYVMTPAEGGFVRLDKETGAMSLCADKDGKWSCTAMADDQEALRRENERLENENKSLKADKKHLEDMLGVGEDGIAGANKQPGAPIPNLQLPSEQDVDKAFDYLERMLKKFRDRMKKLEEPGSGGTPL